MGETALNPVTPAAEPDTAMAAARAEIDAIDQKILALLNERVRANEDIAAAKIAAGVTMPLRPAREVTMLRRLIAEAPQGVDPDLIFDVWRAMIAANVRRQKPVEVVVPEVGDVVRLFDTARRHFSGAARIVRLAEPRDVLNHIAENPSAAAVLPWPAASGPASWWAMLTERRYSKLAIIAGLPMRGTGEPEAALVAPGATLEAAGGDRTFGLAFDPHHRSVRALNEAELKAHETLRVRETVLLELDGFITPGDPRLPAAIRHGLEGFRVVGSYARI
jgi:chorismate mutase / prephenate dehydratase